MSAQKKIDLFYDKHLKHNHTFTQILWRDTSKWAQLFRQGMLDLTWGSRKILIYCNYNRFVNVIKKVVYLFGSFSIFLQKL